MPKKDDGFDDPMNLWNEVIESTSLGDGDGRMPALAVIHVGKCVCERLDAVLAELRKGGDDANASDR